ncbi:MAG TPA: hypothetical protein VH684_21775 [Xanthobacteraceae bacterium]|jgi:hypothetical protein
MIAAIVLVLGLLFLGMQITDPSSNATLGSELNIPPDQALTDWAILNKPLHFMLDDIPLAGLLLFAAGVIYWISDWLNEKLGPADSSPPPAPAESEPK